MAQISLPDTAVIDLATIQTIVNALNRHDEVITQLSASYLFPPKTDSVADSDTEFNTVFNGLAHQIQFGKIKILQADADQTFTVNFDTAFAGQPSVVANARYSNATNANQVNITLNTITTSGFTATLSSEHTVWVYWIAIGTRVA